MKIGYIFCLMLFALGSFTSCKKDKVTNAPIAATATDTIAYKIFSPSKYIGACGSDNYLIDLDFDGVPDAKIRLNCLSGAWNTNVLCGCWTFIFTTNIIFDTIFHSPFIPISRINSYNYEGESNYFYDTISPFNSAMVYNGDTISNSSTQCVGPPPYFLKNSGGFFGFAKSGSLGNKYGWVEFHFDSVSNLFIDGISLNNNINTPIIAGRY